MTEMNRVGLWNTIAAKPLGCSNGSDQLMQSQMKYVIEEVTQPNELYASYRNNLEHGFLDGAGDVLVTAVGVLHLLGQEDFARLPATSDKVLSEEDLPELMDELYLLMQELDTNPVEYNTDTRCMYHKMADTGVYIVNPAQVAHAAIQYVVDMLHIKGYDPEEILKEVNDSNFSKFCKTIEEARASVRIYTAKDRYNKVKYKRTDKFWHLYGNDKLTGAVGKTLKGIHFREPNFIPIIERVHPELIEKATGGK